MSDILHITNGDNLTDYLRELDFNDPIVTWQEMLCEGPTIAAIDSKEFFKIRRTFLKDFYNIEVNEQELFQELAKLNKANDYDEIVLWFEYDLFCHINMIGVINLLHQKEINTNLSLVCSGRIKGEKSLKGLSELTQDQLLLHYRDRVQLTNDDKKLAIALWRTYCGKDHNIFKPYITKPSNFEYMGSCLKAHLKRFPDQNNGLSTIETNILKLIRDVDVKSVHHLLGYILNYQGYYGFGDVQFERIINNLKPFFLQSQNGLELNREGHEAILGHHKVAQKVNNHMVYGGVNRMDYYFSTKQNKLIKSILNNVH
ncbi:DUF1835 domain-containing protein [Winogradskyella aurantiaca]|uniref:DUF1835 domain-containing protein n=1 Tax=Winogradskyella aurantiaca TaxID=2219558 RepID=UPI000E1CDBB3|nr:DUF1835 domain-containing protein [Winogradskyella aurantiaca]